MHEIAIANKIIHEAKKHNPKSSIKIEVGELAELEPRELKEALNRITSWEIKTKLIKAKIKCSCGYQGKPKIIEKGHGYCIFNCPKCQGKPKVLEGGEIKLVGVE